jgi:hypothetical protein
MSYGRIFFRQAEVLALVDMGKRNGLQEWFEASITSFPCMALVRQDEQQVACPKPYSQHLGDICKSLTPDLSITNAFLLEY